MKITKEYLYEELENINKIIQDGFANEACEEYVSMAKNIEEKANETENDVKAEFYGSFAYFLFRVSEYEECLNMFIRAQKYGYPSEEIKEIIWQAFVKPNLDEFKDTYNNNIKLLLSNGCILNAVEFDDLNFWLIPTSVKNVYYIYDKKEELIKERFEFNAQYNVSVPQCVDKFSDFLILEEWNWNKVKSNVNYIKSINKKSYVVIKGIEKLLACFQADILNEKDISDLLIFDGFNSMEEYFNSFSEYLPRNIIDFMDSTIEVKNTIDKIHKYRISKHVSKRDKILLSICIPSYNRGNRAYDNVIHSLKSYYDEEIEIVLSNNGTENGTKSYYDRISLISDSRLKYYAFQENQGFAINICKTMEIAQGRFILFLSDEDLVNFSTLPNIMNMLNNLKETLAVMRTQGDIQGCIPSTKFTSAGEESILTYMLTSNYMSGIIFNNSMIKKYDCIKYIKEKINNAVCANYPHMVWELMLCQYGNAQGTNMILINEGETEKTEVIKKEVGMTIKHTMPHYASIEGRLDQHKGFYNIFNDMEICKNNFSFFRKMYIKLCSKTIYLVGLSINVFYKNTDINILNIIDKAYEFCVIYLDKCYGNNKKCYENYYAEDLKLISDCIELMKKQI